MSNHHGVLAQRNPVSRKRVVGGVVSYALLLDVDAAEYFATHDGGSQKHVIGRSVADLLDLLWSRRIKYWDGPEFKTRMK